MCTRKGHAASVRRQSRQRLRNTSNFSNRWIGEKYPAKAEAAIVRCCPPKKPEERNAGDSGSKLPPRTRRDLDTRRADGRARARPSALRVSRSRRVRGGSLLPESPAFRSSGFFGGQHRTIAASAFAGYFSPIHRFEKFEVLRSRWRLCRLTDAACPLRVHKVFLQFPNLNLEQNPSLTALAI